MGLVVTGCSVAHGGAPTPKPEAAKPSIAEGPAARVVTDQVCATTPVNVVAPWLEHAARPDATPDGLPVALQVVQVVCDGALMSSYLARASSSALVPSGRVRAQYTHSSSAVKAAT